MKVVFFVEKENLQKVKDLVGSGPNSLNKKLVTLINKRSLNFDEDGSYLVIDVSSGAARKLAEELLGNYAEVVEDTSEILKKIEELKERSLKGNYMVFSVEDENLKKVRDLVGIGEDSIVRQSLIFRDNRALGLDKEGDYLMIDGSEEACKEAQKRLKDLAEELEGEEKETVIKKIEEMENSAMEGFGGIFS